MDRGADQTHLWGSWSWLSLAHLGFHPAFIFFYFIGFISLGMVISRALLPIGHLSYFRLQTRGMTFDVKTWNVTET